MYKIIVAILLNLASLATMNVAVTADDVGTGASECAVMCSLPTDNG